MAAVKTRAKPDDALLERILASSPGPADETSERILNAAVTQAEEFGVRRFTIGDVSQRVGLSRVTVYKYFPGKDRLIEAVLLREMRRCIGIRKRPSIAEAYRFRPSEVRRILKPTVPTNDS